MFSKENLKKSVGWIILIIGIFMYVIGFAFMESGSIGHQICIKIADILVIGAVVGYLTGVAQWSGIFKKELQDVIYAKSFLGNRQDIEDIWHKTTSCDTSFPTYISDYSMQ